MMTKALLLDAELEGPVDAQRITFLRAPQIERCSWCTANRDGSQITVPTSNSVPDPGLAGAKSCSRRALKSNSKTVSM
jgi:hypothetical protein